MAYTPYLPANKPGQFNPFEGFNPNAISYNQADWLEKASKFGMADPRTQGALTRAGTQYQGDLNRGAMGAGFSNLNNNLQGGFAGVNSQIGNGFTGLNEKLGEGLNSQLTGIEDLFNRYGSLGGLGGIQSSGNASAVYRPQGQVMGQTATGGQAQPWASSNPFNATF